MKNKFIGTKITNAQPSSQSSTVYIHQFLSMVVNYGYYWKAKRVKYKPSKSVYSEKVKMRFCITDLHIREELQTKLKRGIHWFSSIGVHSGKDSSAGRGHMRRMGKNMPVKKLWGFYFLVWEARVQYKRDKDRRRDYWNSMIAKKNE